MVEQARAKAFSSQGVYAREWQSILERPIDEIVRAMTEESDPGSARRQASPFAGALDPRERWTLWREVRERLMR
jgi:hypothetical protein